MTNLKRAVGKAKKTKSVGQTQDEQVYCHIFDAILEQRLPPATKLSEEALAEIFDVSRTIIRRALLRLSLEQVVVIRPNRGAVVAAPTVEEAQQIFKAREVMELATTELAVENASAEQIAQCREMVSKEDLAFSQGDYGQGLRLSGEFHIKLAEMANNAPLLAFQRSLVSQTSLLIAQYETRGQSNCSLAEHSALLDALESRNKEQALQLMKQHLQHMRAKLTLTEDRVSQDLHDVFSDIIKKRSEH